MNKHILQHTFENKILHKRNKLKILMIVINRFSGIDFECSVSIKSRLRSTNPVLIELLNQMVFENIMIVVYA